MTDSDEVKLLPCEERLWSALARFQSNDRTWLQIGKRDFVAALSIIRPPVVTDEVVERVAKAIYKSAQDYVLQNTPKNVKLPTWESEEQECRDVMASIARAAIASMPAVVSGRECNILDKTQEVCPRHGHCHAPSNPAPPAQPGIKP